MDVQERKKSLLELYHQHEVQVTRFKEGAACVPGCADCCIEVGDIDMTTLEGILIHQRIGTFDLSLQQEIEAALAANIHERNQGRRARCAFLRADQTCRIYDIRPFSCRQLYSVTRCSGAPPTIHRQAVELARETVRRIQSLDPNGYSGHMSYLLFLLAKRKFRESYLQGKFEPQKIAQFGRTHRIRINRAVVSGNPR